MVIPTHPLDWRQIYRLKPVYVFERLFQEPVKTPVHGRRMTEDQEVTCTETLGDKSVNRLAMLSCEVNKR